MPEHDPDDRCCNCGGPFRRCGCKFQHRDLDCLGEFCPCQRESHLTGQCMRDAAVNWMPLALEMRFVLLLADVVPSPVGLAHTVSDVYPEISTYGLMLACQWATTTTEIGA